MGKAIYRGVCNRTYNLVTKWCSYVRLLGCWGWRSGKSTRLPPMWPGFDSQTRRHVWIEFVCFLLCTVFLRVLRFSPLLKNQYLLQYDLLISVYSVPNECSGAKTTAYIYLVSLLFFCYQRHSKSHTPISITMP